MATAQDKALQEISKLPPAARHYLTNLAKEANKRNQQKPGSGDAFIKSQGQRAALAKTNIAGAGMFDGRRPQGAQGAGKRANKLFGVNAASYAAAEKAAAKKSTKTRAAAMKAERDRKRASSPNAIRTLPSR